MDIKTALEERASGLPVEAAATRTVLFAPGVATLLERNLDPLDHHFKVGGFLGFDGVEGEGVRVVAD